jgi:hypothetical protein
MAGPVSKYGSASLRVYTLRHRIKTFCFNMLPMKSIYFRQALRLSLSASLRPSPHPLPWRTFGADPLAGQIILIRSKVE